MISFIFRFYWRKLNFSRLGIFQEKNVTQMTFLVKTIYHIWDWRYIRRARLFQKLIFFAFLTICLRRCSKKIQQHGLMVGPYCQPLNTSVDKKIQARSNFRVNTGNSKKTWWLPAYYLNMKLLNGQCLRNNMAAI